jgi:hypothetical protein
VLREPTVHNGKTLALLSFRGLRSHNPGAIYRAGNNMEASIMNDNVSTLFPSATEALRPDLATLCADDRAAILGQDREIEREIILAGVMRGIAALNEAGDVRYRVVYSPVA